MPHDDMTANDVLDLVREHLPAATKARMRSDGEISFVLYDAFAVRGLFDDYGEGNWGFGVLLGGNESVSSPLGRRLTIRGTREQVRVALEDIDYYVRLRLGSEYLAAYEDAYGASQS
ncbi:hypothetical protein [Marisediminicola sp. LYQ134]|uniref:hypothetical protein n=1 Tax=Marisediminicola sp. LYQ134 TaxID=3391061 RepID=UPI003983C554